MTFDIQEQFRSVATAAAAQCIVGVEGFVSEAIGQPVSISSGPAGQIVISPKSNRLPKRPEKTALNLALPTLLGAALINLGKRPG